ncbi:MAG: glycosyltransferase family 4 protein [Planctomycetota bacterium]
MKVGVLVNGFERYGVRQAVLSLTDQLRRRGVGVRVFSIARGPFTEELERLGVPLDDLGQDRVPAFAGASIPQRLSAFLRARRAVRAIVPELSRAIDAAEVNGLYVRWPNLVELAGRACVGTGARAFWHMPNIVGSTLPFGLNRRYFQRLCRRYRVVPMANSTFTAKTLGDRPVRPEVLYVGTDAERFDPQRVEGRGRAELGLGGDAIVLGIVSRVDRSKGHDRVLRAMLSCTHPLAARLVLLAVGGPADGPYAEELRSIAAGAGAEDRLRLVGRVDDVPRWYGVIDIAVNGRVDPEPFGQSVVEAMLMKRPIVVHALGGPAESVVDGQTGWHVNSPEVDAWERAIHRVLDDREAWPRMGEAARSRSLELYSASAMCDRFLDLVSRYGASS